jgi:hypothetical protein
MADYAWMSVARGDPDFTFSIRTEALLSEDPEELQKALDPIHKNQNGQPIPSDVLPKTMFAWRGPYDESKQLPKKLPHLSSCGGGHGRHR